MAAGSVLPWSSEAENERRIWPLGLVRFTTISLRPEIGAELGRVKMAPPAHQAQ